MREELKKIVTWSGLNTHALSARSGISVEKLDDIFNGGDMEVYEALSLLDSLGLPHYMIKILL